MCCAMCYRMNADIFGELHSVQLPLPAPLKVMVPLLIILKGEVSFVWHVTLAEGKTTAIS